MSDAKQDNYFSLFELETGFEIDIEKLEANYLKLQERFHPDRFINSSEQNKTAALQNTMIVNDAYAVIKNPLHRAEYLLKLNGVTVNSGNDTIKPSQTILLESLDARQRLEDVVSNEELAVFKNEVSQEIRQLQNQMIKFFEYGQLESAAYATIRLRYLEKLYEEINDKRN